jgi:hypothetical protein
MMTHRQWLNCILTSAQHVASREYQERSWLGKGGNEISSPEEVYCQLIEDCTFDLFFETLERVHRGSAPLVGYLEVCSGALLGAHAAIS